jgi:outer membrane receptor protein involved in Fe transport
MKQSLSVSTLEADQILLNQPANASDVLRSIPGVHSESSGGGGNANVTVRGLPISAGGARYVQFQEDGLPVLLFGDIAFATPDMFIRADGGLDHLEVVRGGSASTLATNSPGGVINFISKTGEERGGSVGISHGLGYDSTRVDFDYGSPIGNKTRAFISGYYNVGEGPRNATSSSEQGGQIRGNLTHELDNGFVRVSFKHLDEKSPLFMPAPVAISNGHISELPGIDPRKATFYSPYWVTDYTLTKNNTLVGSNVNDGLTVKTDALGLEGSFNVGDGWSLTDKAQFAKNSGRFISIFPADNVSAAPVGSTYATGPNKGNAYTGNVFTATVFNTSLDDLGTSTNDLKLAKVFSMDGGNKLTATGGLFLNLQKVALTWNFNQYLMQATDNKPALIANSTTNALGLVAQGTDVWGGCCTRNIDAQYRTTSPYVALGLENGPLNVDASLRSDHQVASGSYMGATAQQFDRTKQSAIDYKIDHTSYSTGLNYRLTNQLAAFARYSNGVAFNADRIMFGSANLSNGVIPINEVKQLEGGVKWREGGLSTFVTLFQAKTTESNYDATTQKSSANDYDAKGVEVEAGYRAGMFSVTGGFTYTKAKITGSNDPTLVGKTPNRLAKLVYQLTPTLNFGDLVVGANLVGTTDSKDAQNSGFEATLPGYTLVNAFVSYKLSQNVTASLGVSNLFDKIAYSESNDGRAAARASNGRTGKVGLKYAF